MAVIGYPADWVDLIDPMVPDILRLVITSWESMPSPATDEREDNITNELCRRLQQNRTARELPFQIRPQVIELDPMPSEDLGRLDIAFIPLIPCEDIYFCLESKRLNVIRNGKPKAHASEYVKKGMVRFITGQYSKSVRHGGMLGYVLDGDITSAMANVEKNIRRQKVALGMTNSAGFMTSTALSEDNRARETQHQRAHQTEIFRIHHLFMANRTESIGSLP